MSATVVVGQTNFTSGSVNQGGSATATSLNSPASVIVAENKLIIADNGNQRVLIYKTIPATANTAADVVIGQTNFTSATSGCTASKLNLGDGRIFYIGGKLYIADSGNNRVLVFNSIPTTSGKSADIVIGQSNFTTCTSGLSANSLSSPIAIASDGKKLLISDFNNNRVLVYNTIPSVNNPTASNVIGQPDFISNMQNNGGLGANTLVNPIGVSVNIDGVLFVADSGNARVLLYNGIPTTDFISADNIIGQSDFNFKSTAQKKGTTLVTQATQPTELTTDGNGTLFIAEKSYNRATVFSAFSAINGPQPDISIGQPNLTSVATNSGGLSALSLSNPKSVFSSGTYIYIVDNGNNRVLLYPNTILTPNLNLDNGAKGQPDSTVTISGTATVNTQYTIKDVQFSINGGGFYDATPTSGTFKSSTENFSYNLDPSTNNNTQDGYTARVRIFNSNGDQSGTGLYFQPFFVNKPDDGSFTANTYPVFDFSVNGQRAILSSSLIKYQIQVTKTGTTNWQTYIDNIPVDFRKIKNNSDNLQRTKYSFQNINGIYETTNLYAVYDEDSSHILVHAKEDKPLPFDQGGAQLSGSYVWRVVAVDNGGHTQMTSTQTIRVNTSQTLAANTFFPLSLLSISGLEDLNISTLNPTAVKDSYTAATKQQTFYGIADAGATITLSLSDQSCQAAQIDCSILYTTTVNPQSRFGINVPEDSLDFGKNYTIILSAQLGDNYIELPKFTLMIEAPSLAKKSTTNKFSYIEKYLSAQYTLEANKNKLCQLQSKALQQYF